MKEKHNFNKRTDQQLMKEIKQKLTLDRPVNYQIKVPGHLDDRWSDLNDEMIVTIESDDEILPCTTLTGTFDQAALQGLLRRLYSLGSPLVSVVCMDCGLEDI
jgi:hypothetical protein